MADEVILHHAWRTEESHRVRLALALKEIPYETRDVDLAAKEQHGEAYRAVSPGGLVPALQIDGETLTNSMAILEYLEETRPTPPLLPGKAVARARVRAFAEVIAAEISPICAGPVVDHVVWLTPEQEDGRGDWLRKWIARGLKTLELMLASPATGAFVHGDEPGYADCLLIPQLRVARVWGAPVWRFPRLTAIELGCASHPAFVAAQPENWAPDPAARRSA